MKRFFWLAFAIMPMTVATHAQASIGTSQVTVIENDIDSIINDLISQSNQANRNIDLSLNTSQVVLPTLSSTKLTANSAPNIAANLASNAAHHSSTGRCALYVRKALQSAGYEFTPQPSAYQYATNGTLQNAGFVKINSDNYQPQVGDVVVFNRTSRNPHGHIQIYDGNDWVSDFRQPNFSPYRNHNGYTVWRDARYLDASANTGTMMAMNDY
ncbi:CHAP domain-containing protein [Moraxella nasovis]|uniref:CHAP domain-containing protein n=1 Tax=Moraxella nasovis TaxID=2904121 RepID=UPI001F604B75|nr:CHAP domain-containing protein [Moraxella nasovis]UNU73872.1 CHAP domain-containing protein [Moraxella nasovis]